MLVQLLIKTAIRITIFAIITTLFFTNPTALDYLNTRNPIPWLFWAVLATDMLFRLIPNRKIPIGARKHFASSFAPAVNPCRRYKSPHRGAFLCALTWVAITGGTIAAMRFAGILSPAALIVFAALYAVVDMLFILVFCPFRAFFTRARCCATCRIHAWDYPMIIMPLIIYPGVVSISLFVMAALVVARWEIALMRHPERFSDEFNINLRCSNCIGKICKLRIKPQIRHK